MISRRLFIIALGGVPLAACNTTVTDTPQVSLGNGANTFASDLHRNPQYTSGRSKRRELARETVSYQGNERPGTIVINTSERRLFLVLDNGKALRYPVGVGRAGKKWEGRAEVDGKHVEPAWSPPEEVKRDNPRVPDVIAGGSPGNPMGPRALTLSGGGQYAIHGTNRPHTVGTFSTYGCIRMFNEDIVDLFERVRVGTEVVVTA